MANLLLWPRQEILQLIIPQLVASGGKTLSVNLVLNVVKQLSKYQTTEGKITFDRWLVAGKDILKWNEYSLQLFWDMSILALAYSKTECTNQLEEISVDFSSLAIFLVLHIGDLPTKSTIPVTTYDAVWPSEIEGTNSPPSLSSPIKAPSPISLGLRISSSTPPSPRSPVHSPRAHPMSGASSVHSPRTPLGSSSPKRSSLMSPRASRSASHYLYLIRQKLPIILRALTLDESSSIETARDNTDVLLNESDFMVSTVQYGTYNQV